MTRLLVLLGLVGRGLRRTSFWVIPLLFLALLGAVFVFIIFPAADVWLIWRIYRGYVDTVASVTGLNAYLVSAAGLLAFVPFYYAVSLVLKHPFSSAYRWRGLTILLVLAVLYNTGLYYVTRDMTFGFKTGAAQRWYAVTPAGVRFFDRPGFEPEYGIALQPVTPENIPTLKLLARGDFARVDPMSARFFNPHTGAAELWYYRNPDEKGSIGFEFYNKPGFHPDTGAALNPVTREVYVEWSRLHDQEEKARRAAEEKARLVRLAAEAKARTEREADCKRRREEWKKKYGDGAAGYRVYPPGYGGFSTQTLHNTWQTGQAWATASTHYWNGIPDCP